MNTTYGTYSTHGPDQQGTCDPAAFTADGIDWTPSTDPHDMVGVDYTTQHAYQTTVNDLVYVLNSRTMPISERLEWWFGARHLDFSIGIGAHSTAVDAAQYVASILAQRADFFLVEDGVLVLNDNGVFVVPDEDADYD